MARTAVSLPPELARRPNRVFRPRDAGAIYAQPRTELARLTRNGVVQRLVAGYYAVVPQERLGDRRWTPSLEAAALGIGQADYGVGDVALMAGSAARYHGAVPRAIATAVVAVPKQRPVLETAIGRVIFVKRDVTRLDVERIDTQLTSGWVTTVEQTILDLAARPMLGGLTVLDATEAVHALAMRADWSLVSRLARDQHKPSAFRLAAAWSGHRDA